MFAGKSGALRGTTQKCDVSKVKQNLLNSLASDVPQTSPAPGSSTVKRYFVINNAGKNDVNRNTADLDLSRESILSEAVSLSPSDATPVQAEGDQILLKAHLSHPNLSDRQPTLLKLSKTQLQSVLQSMSPGSSGSNVAVSSSDYKVKSNPVPNGLLTVPVQMQDGSQVQLLHANKTKIPSELNIQKDFLVGPPDVSRVKGRKRPVDDETSTEECYFNAKRPRKDVETKSEETTRRSPLVDSEVAAINSSHLNKITNAAKARPSPLRALHLEPEFQSSQQTTVSKESNQGKSPTATVTRTSLEQSTSQVKQNAVTHPSVVRHRPGLMRSKSASPSTFMFGGKGVGSLQSEPAGVHPQSCTYVNASESMMSPQNGITITPVNSITQPGITTRVLPSGGYQITPTSSIIRPSRNIAPSSSAIVNLVPHLQSGTTQEAEGSAAKVISMPVSSGSNGGTRILTRKLSADQIMALRARQNQVQPQMVSIPVGPMPNVHAQTQFLRIDTQGTLQTPTQQQQQQLASQIISPSMNNTTPSTQLATPTSFFQSTPSGSLIRITTHQISPPSELTRHQGSAISAFRVVSGQTFTPITETVTARRLTLSAEQTP